MDLANIVQCRRHLCVGLLCCSLMGYAVGCSTGPGYYPTTLNPVGYGPGATPITYIPVNSGPGGGTTVVGYPPASPVPVLPIPVSPVPTIPVSIPGVPMVDPAPVGPVAGPVPDPVPIPPTSPTTPAAPSNDPTVAWSPWPLPPSNSEIFEVKSESPMQMMSHAADAEVYGRPRCSSVMRNSKAHHRHRNQAGLPGGKPRLAQLAEGIPSTPSQDLHYRGGKVLQDMSYVNLYVGGDAAWKKSDIQEIDAALAAAMTDRNLNNVMMQYFNNHPIVTRPLASHPLVGYRPGTVSQGDVEFYLAYLCKQGYLKSFDLPTTVFNFLLPQGTVLNDEPNRTGHAETAKTGNQVATKAETNPTIPKADEGDSKGGLGGYHGSVHVGNITLYYTVDVYSERKGDGTTNGIPAFADPWKNVVATLYHELNEARTDPDVEDAIRNSSNSQAAQYLGWTSDAGEEVGDYPLDEATKLSLVIKEVPVTDGSRTVPVQLQYSNAVHGPEGPIPQPHPLQ